MGLIVINENATDEAGTLDSPGADAVRGEIQSCIVRHSNERHRGACDVQANHFDEADCNRWVRNLDAVADKVSWGLQVPEAICFKGVSESGTFDFYVQPHHETEGAWVSTAWWCNDLEEEFATGEGRTPTEAFSNCIKLVCEWVLLVIDEIKPPTPLPGAPTQGGIDG